MAAGELNERAVRAAVDVAAGAGLDVGAPTILSDKSNLIVHLAPAPVVARVSTTTGTVRQGRAWLDREAAVAGYLASAGAPVVPPSPALAPGTHERDGLAMTFWEHVEERDGDLDPERAGRALHDCHEALAGFTGDLPVHGTLREAEDNLERLIDAGTLDPDDGDLLRAVSAVVIDGIDRTDLPLRPVHGDAHLGNVVNSAAGPLWNDWEDAHRSSLEWDHACMLFSQRPGSADAARAAFAGRDVDDDALDLFLEARRLQVTVWAAVVADVQPSARQAFEIQIARYREQAGWEGLAEHARAPVERIKRSRGHRKRSLERSRRAAALRPPEGESHSAAVGCPPMVASLTLAVIAGGLCLLATFVLDGWASALAYGIALLIAFGVVIVGTDGKAPGPF